MKKAHKHSIGVCLYEVPRDMHAVKSGGVNLYKFHDVIFKGPLSANCAVTKDSFFATMFYGPFEAERIHDNNIIRL